MLPAHTRDPNDDYLVEITIRAEAIALVSADKDLVPEDPWHWTDETRGVTVTAFGSQSFLEEHLNTSGFGIDEVDPRLLELVVAPLP